MIKKGSVGHQSCESVLFCSALNSNMSNVLKMLPSLCLSVSVALSHSLSYTLSHSPSLLLSLFSSTIPLFYSTPFCSFFSLPYSSLFLSLEVYLSRFPSPLSISGSLNPLSFSPSSTISLFFISPFLSRTPTPPSLPSHPFSSPISLSLLSSVLSLYLSVPPSSLFIPAAGPCYPCETHSGNKV